jgi:hypothetical protein
VRDGSGRWASPGLVFGGSGLGTVGVSLGGVRTTKDGGAHWELIGFGLRNAYRPPEKAGDPLTQDGQPIVHCPADDLMYRDALDVAREGERPAFGSSTGSL